MTKWFTDAVLLAVFSVLGYAVAYSYESGYASHFGFPGYLISPTPAVIASSLVALSVGAQFVTTLWAFWLRQNSLEAKTAIGLFIASALGIFIAVVFFAEANSAAYGVAVAAFVAMVCGAFFVFMHRASEGTAAPRRVSDPRTEGVVNAVFASVCLLLVANIAGVLVAQKQTTFFVLEKDRSYAVVRMYGDVVVAVKFDPASEQIAGDYLVGKFGADDFRLQLRRQRFTKPRPLNAAPSPS